MSNREVFCAIGFALATALLPIVGGLAARAQDEARAESCTTDAECALTPACIKDPTCDGGPR